MGSADGLHRRSTKESLSGSTRRATAVNPCTGMRGTMGTIDHSLHPSKRPASMELQAMAVEFPVVQGHPNRLPFEGVLTLVGVASDKAPSGSRGHRVMLTHEAAEAALPSLLGMAVDYKAGWDGHDARQKCGIITSAALEGKRLNVAGYLFARDYPEMEQKMQVEGAMGMSYELADAHVADMRAPVWTLTQATFTGAAILLREKAAYRNTSFRLKRDGGVHAAATPMMSRHSCKVPRPSSGPQ